jgi:hypothetical protein
MHDATSPSVKKTKMQSAHRAFIELEKRKENVKKLWMEVQADPQSDFLKKTLYKVAFNEIDGKTEDARKVWMDAQVDYEYSVNGMDDCLERVLKQYPDQIESNFLEEIDVYRRLSDSRKTRIKNKVSTLLLVQQLTDGLEKFRTIKGLLTEHAQKLDTMIYLLERAIEIEIQNPTMVHGRKRELLNTSILRKFNIILHTGYTNNLLNVVEMGRNLYQKLYPRGRLSPKRLLEFKHFIKDANDRSGCIDKRIDDLSSFIYQGENAVDISSPFFTNLSFIISRKLREECGKKGSHQVIISDLITKLARDTHFKNYIDSVLKHRPNLIYDQLKKADRVVPKFPDQHSPTWVKEWEDILVPIFRYLIDDLAIFTTTDDEMFLICPPPLQQHD